jgi:hypothetical protein
MGTNIVRIFNGLVLYIHTSIGGVYMLSELMREVLLLSLSSEHYLDPEEYSSRTLRALLKKGFLQFEEEDYEVTEQGIQALGITKRPTGKRPKTIIKKVWNDLYGVEPLFLSRKDLPSIAADEDHNSGRTSWYDFSDVLFAIESYGDLEEECIVQIACDYANKEGHGLYTERVRHLVLFYREE